MASNMTVWSIVDDGPFDRDTAPYDDFNRASKIVQASPVDPFTADIIVATGKTVTLIAMEDTGFTAGVSNFTDLDNLRSPFRVYFVGWEGDDGVPMGEGVISLVMDSNRSVRAVFDQMPLLTWGKINETDASRSGGCFDIEVQAALLLGRPGDSDISGSSSAGQCGIGGEIVFFGQLKPGSVVTVTATDISGDGQMFDRWQGSGCGGSPACRIQVTEQDASTTAIWR